MSEIVDKLDKVLDRLDSGSKENDTKKKSVLRVISLIKTECPEDKVLLLQTEYIIQNYWHVDRKKIKENLDFVLNYFNILRDKKFNIEFRKTKTKKVQGSMVRELYIPKSKEEILVILGE